MYLYLDKHGAPRDKKYEMSIIVNALRTDDNKTKRRRKSFGIYYIKAHTGVTHWWWFDPNQIHQWYGAVYASQKLNTRISTEAELVGVYDAMPQMLWTKKFLTAQGFDSRVPSYIRTIRVLCSCKNMVKAPAVSGQGTLMCAITTLLIV